MAFEDIVATRNPRGKPNGSIIALPRRNRASEMDCADPANLWCEVTKELATTISTCPPGRWGFHSLIETWENTLV